MDQRQSRGGDDILEEHRRELNRRYRSSLVGSFVRTAGDEMQGVANDAGWLVDLVLRETREARWWIGIGVGPFDPPLGRSARDSRGLAFYRAREAVERAKRAPWGFAFSGAGLVGQAEDCLALTSFVVRTRTERQHEAVECYREVGQANEAAARLGISPPSMSERLRGAGLMEEDAGRRVAAYLLGQVAERP